MNFLNMIASFIWVTVVVGSFNMSLKFSDETGQGQGEIKLNYSLDGEMAPLGSIPMKCFFLQHSKFNVHVSQPVQNNMIVCETISPVIKGEKIGVPFFKGGFGLPFNLSTYIQMETGDHGHGTLLAQQCEVVEDK